MINIVHKKVILTMDKKNTGGWTGELTGARDED